MVQQPRNINTYDDYLFFSINGRQIANLKQKAAARNVCIIFLNVDVSDKSYA